MALKAKRPVVLAVFVVVVVWHDYTTTARIFRSEAKAEAYATLARGAAERVDLLESEVE